MRNQSFVLRRIALIAIIILIAASGCCTAQSPKNVIMLIGDGMGIGVITSARIDGHGADGQLAIDTMPVTGLVTNYPAKGLVTDSAASATALATGKKTTNGTISKDPDGKSLRTILEVARDMGKSTGLVSTQFITDATPAAFASHAASRKERFDIASQMVDSKVDVILGGGQSYFVPSSEGGNREDGVNLLSNIAKQGWAVFSSAEDMKNSSATKAIGLFASNAMTTRRPEPTIAEMTGWALGALNKNKNGFFIMSEGGLIDGAAHGNNTEGTIRETLMFDDAVKTALDFAAKDGKTLVIVTADHDTGGMAVCNPESENVKLTAKWIHSGHTGNMIAVYAYGPGAQHFTGTLDNTDIPKIIAKLWKQKLND